MREVGEVLGVAIDCKSLTSMIDETLLAIESKSKQVTFACANAHSLEVAQRDAEFKAALNSASLVVADGVGVTMVAHLIKSKVGPRITGHEYFISVLQALEKKGAGRVFFFGSSERVLSLIADRFKRDYPALELCGTLSPPFHEWSAEENADMISKINRARPDILWVGMTAPKQEKWVSANCRQLKVPVIGSIGAVFDFYAGTYARAPKWMRKIGMEWLHRLISQPRRLWRRYLVSSPKVVLLAIWKNLHSTGRH